MTSLRCQFNLTRFYDVYFTQKPLILYFVKSTNILMSKKKFFPEYWQFHPISLNDFKKESILTEPLTAFVKLTLGSNWVFSEPKGRKNENKCSCINKNGHADPCSTQLAFTCSKLAIEILEQGVKYVQK